MVTLSFSMEEYVLDKGFDLLTHLLKEELEDREERCVFVVIPEQMMPCIDFSDSNHTIASYC